jgi:prolyl oligopeptidase PreP (S9A serine peptidase family)
VCSITESFSPENAKTVTRFAYLYAYSPLHHIAKGCCYPVTFITTADHDDRVVPAHSFKFAATLQAAQGCDKTDFDSNRNQSWSRRWQPDSENH